MHLVDDLRLAIHGRDVAFKDAATDFANRVLERAGDRLEERFPTRIVCVRHLPLTLRVAEDALDATAEIEEAAARLADRLAEHRGVGDDVAVFSDEALRRAAILALPAGSVWPWWADDLTALPGPAALATVALDDGQVWMVLEELQRSAVLTGMVAQWSDTDCACLLARLPPAQVLGTLNVDPHIVALVRRWRRHWRTLPTPAFTIAALVRLRCETGLTGDAARAAVACASVVVGDHPSAPDTPDAVVPGMKRLPGGELSAGDEATADDGTAMSAALTAAPTSSAVPTGVTSARLPATSTDHLTALGATLPSGFSGLAYLLARTSECAVGEALWRACLPEGVVLAHAWAGLVGDDPIAAVLSGHHHAISPCPVLTREQAEEIRTAITTATLTALAHRGLAGPLALHLQVVEARGLIVAQLRDSAAVVAAWPRAQHRQALQAVTQDWRNATWTAEPSLTQLHPALVTAGSGLPSPVLPAAPDTETAAILAQVVGAPLAVFSARAGLRADELHACLAIAGSVQDDGETIRITMPAAAIDQRLRCAGLDADPGHVPWLGRNVRLAFSGGEEF